MTPLRCRHVHAVTALLKETFGLNLRPVDVDTGPQGSRHRAKPPMPTAQPAEWIVPENQMQVGSG